MKIKGEVGALENTGDGVLVTIINAKRVGLAYWQAYQPDIKVEIPQGRAKHFRIGRSATVTVELNGTQR